MGHRSQQLYREDQCCVVEWTNNDKQSVVYRHSFMVLHNAQARPLNKNKQRFSCTMKYVQEIITPLLVEIKEIGHMHCMQSSCNLVSFPDPERARAHLGSGNETTCNLVTSRHILQMVNV